MQKLAIEKEMLDNGVPWDVIQNMPESDIMARYKVWTLPFLQKSNGLM